MLADIDGDGEVELIITTSNDEVGARLEVMLYNQQRNQLAALERTADGIEVATMVELGGTGVTNIAVQNVGSVAALAVGTSVGTSAGTLRIWTPRAPLFLLLSE